MGFEEKIEVVIELLSYWLLGYWLLSRVTGNGLMRQEIKNQAERNLLNDFFYLFDKNGVQLLSLVNEVFDSFPFNIKIFMNQDIPQESKL